MRNKFNEHREFLNSISHLQDIKEKIDKVEKRHNTFVVCVTSAAIIATVLAVVATILRKTRYDYDAFYDDEDFYGDDFEDEFDDLDEGDFE